MNGEKAELFKTIVSFEAAVVPNPDFIVFRLTCLEPGMQKPEVGSWHAISRDGAKAMSSYLSLELQRLELLTK